MEGFDFSVFPTLSTQRLILREILPLNSADFFALNSDPEVLKYDVDPPLHGISEALALIEQIRRNFVDKQSISWGICRKDDDRLIGNVAFYFQDKAYYKADLGYRVARPYWRQGLATEAIRAIMQFGFKTMHLHRINVDTRTDNLASIHLMERLGFTFEGARRECVRNPDGTYQTWGLFGMLENEYEGSLTK